MDDMDPGKAMTLKKQLIQEVKKRRNLWDTSNAQYKDTALRDRCWLDISRALDENCDVLKCEWKRLRDGYRQAINRKKTLTKKGTTPAMWRFERPMSFLMPVMCERASLGQLKPYQNSKITDVKTYYSKNVDLEESEPEEMEDDHFEEVLLSEEDNIEKPRETIFTVAPNVSNERFSNDQADDLELFFKSLCETTRKLPKTCQNKIKSQLLMIVSKVEEDHYTASDSNFFCT